MAKAGRIVVRDHQLKLVAKKYGNKCNCENSPVTQNRNFKTGASGFKVLG